MNILFIGGQGRMPDANGVCIRNMAKEMVARGHRVWVLARGNDNTIVRTEQDDSTLFEVPTDYFSRLTKYEEKSHNRLYHFIFRIICLIRHFLLLFFYPNTAPIRAIRISRLANRIVSDNNIELVVCTFVPYENIYAGIRLKKKYGNSVKVISYHLDLRTESQSASKIVRRYIFKHALKSVVKENRVVDKMMIPYSGKNSIMSLKDIDLNKIDFVGLPVYLIDTPREKCPLPFDKKEINICYIGSLHPENRNPQYVLELLECISASSDCKLRVHFWGDVKSFESLLTNSPITCYHGMVENRYVRYIMDNADFILNIGNAVAYDLLPSKVFSTFATGKPIINVVGHPDDVTLPYFARYNNSVEIDAFNRKREDVDKLASFINIKKGFLIPASEDLFRDFSPEVICDKLLN